MPRSMYAICAVQFSYSLSDLGSAADTVIGTRESCWNRVERAGTTYTYARPDGARFGQKPLSCHHRRLGSLFIVLAVGEQVAQQT